MEFDDRIGALLGGPEADEGTGVGRTSVENGTLGGPAGELGFS